MEYLLKPNVHLSEAEQTQAQALSAEYGLEPVVGSLLVSRGVKTNEDARRFLRPQPEDLHDPFLFRDMEKAVSLIRDAIASGGRIWVHGDYDADGTSAAAILQRALSSLGADVTCHIPSRTGHGYGLAFETVEEMAGAALLITADCGISSVNEIARARELGIRTIITDHHTPPALLPEPDAMLNAKVSGETYPCRDLCGAGVAFKVVQALLGEQALELLDLAAFGTVADVVPLTGENRTIVALGLRKFERSPNPGLAALYGPHRERRGPLTAEGISFLLAPSVNAAGRMASARLALDLMTAEQTGSARIIAATLAKLNEDRQVRQKQITDEAAARLAAMERLPDFIVLQDPTWEAGLIGVAASVLCETYARPVLLLGGRQGSQFVGSARSTADLNVYDALKSVEALLIRFGGHAGAAGLTVEADSIPALAEALNDWAAARAAGRARAEADYDLEASLPLSAELVDSLAVLEPCGFGNPRPRFLLRQAHIGDVRPLSGGAHAAFGLYSKTGRIDAVRFRTAPENIPPEADVVGTVQINSFRGEERVQLTVDVFSVWEKDDAVFEELAREVCRPGPPHEPWRFRCGKPRLGLIYSALRRVSEVRGALSWRPLFEQSSRLVPDLRPEEFVYAVCVFTQLKLLAGSKNGKMEVIISAPRRSLDSSEIYRKFEGADDGSQGKDSEH